MALPYFLTLAISHEKSLIELRKRQIEGYEKRIKLMEAGLGYDEALTRVPPVKACLNFARGHYQKSKNRYEREKEYLDK